MKRTSIVTKLGASVAALVIAQALLFLILGGIAFRSQAYPARIRLVENTIVLLRAVIEPIPNRDDIPQRLEGLSKLQGFALGLYDERGELVYMTRKDVGLESRLAPETMEQARGFEGHALLLRGRLPTENSVAVATFPSGSVASFVAFADSGTPQHVMRGIVAAFQTQILVIVVLTLLLTWWLTTRARRSLGEIEHVVARMADGDLTIRLPIRGHDEVARVASSYNRMADALAERIEQLRRSEAQRTRMFAAFTHEISTPLTSVLGYLESLRMDEINDDPVARRRYVEIAYAQARALDALAEDLAMLSRLDFEGLTLERESLDLGAWARAEIAPFEERGKVREVSFHLDVPEPVTAHIDPRRLGQVLRILLDNALRHAPDGSTVHSSIRADVETIEIEVRDQGKGVPAEHLERLGEPLHRVDPSRSRDTGGRGLGLSIASGLVKAHGGSLHFESPPNSGLIVRARLPRSA